MAAKTTGQLRADLAQLMEDIRARRIKPEDASMLIKAAGRITDSLYSEAKIAQMAQATRQLVPEFGKLTIE